MSAALALAAASRACAPRSACATTAASRAATAWRFLSLLLALRTVDGVGGQAGQAEHQQYGEDRQYHVHAHQVPVDGEQETHIVRCRGEGRLTQCYLANRSLSSHPGPTTDAFSSSQRRRSSRSAVTTRQLSPAGDDLRDHTDDRVITRAGRGHQPHRWPVRPLAPSPPRRHPVAPGGASAAGGDCIQQRRRLAGLALEDEHPGAPAVSSSAPGPARSPPAQPQRGTRPVAPPAVGPGAHHVGHVDHDDVTR